MIIREILMKIFLDIRTRFKSCKVVILYYACLLHMIEHKHTRVIDIALGVIFRKLKFLTVKQHSYIITKSLYEEYGLDVEDLQS